MYSVTAYFFGKVVSELPASIITPVVFGSIVYFSIGLSTVFAWKFPLFRKFSRDWYINYSWSFDIDLQCIRSICIDYFNTVLRQTVSSHPDTCIDYPFHAFRWFLRESVEHPHLVDIIPVLVVLQVRISSADAQRVSGPDPCLHEPTSWSTIRQVQPSRRFQFPINISRISHRSRCHVFRMLRTRPNLYENAL